MRAIWVGQRRVFPDGRVFDQPVEEKTCLVNGVFTTVRVAQVVPADCGCAVKDLGDLYQCCACLLVICWRCAARCEFCSRTVCSLHALARTVDQDRVVCPDCCLELESPRWIRKVKGVWRWLLGSRSEASKPRG